MTINAEIKVDVDALMKHLDHFAVDGTRAMIKGVNNAAFDVRKVWLDTIATKVDSPTPFTKNSKAVLVGKATEDNPTAEVFVQRTQNEYLATLVEGGVRGAGDLGTVGGNVLIPVGARLNKFGNFPEGPKRYLGKLSDDGNVFTGKLPSPTRSGADYALYQRKGKKRQLSVLAVFGADTKYKENSLPLYDVAQQQSDKILQEISNALDIALA